MFPLFPRASVCGKTTANIYQTLRILSKNSAYPHALDQTEGIFEDSRWHMRLTAAVKFSAPFNISMSTRR